MADRRIYPMPELIVAEHVTIEAGSGSMDNTAKIMRVPLADTPAARHIRAHEMAHAAISPLSPAAPRSIAPQAVQRAEDMRMNHHCRKHGLHEAMDAPTADKRIIESLVTLPLCAGDELAAVTAASAVYQTGDWDMCMDAIRSVRGADYANRITKFIQERWAMLDGKEEPSWADTLDNARALTEFAGWEPPEPTKPEPEREPDSGPGMPDSGPGMPDSGPGKDMTEPDSGPGKDMIPVDLSGDIMDALIDHALEAAIPKPVDPVEDSLAAVQDYAKYASARGYPIGADNFIVRDIPKPKRLVSSRLRGKTPVPAEYGANPRHIERYCTDRQIFVSNGKRRRNGGVIIIDCSGSMALSDEDVERVMIEAPLGTIATYSGSPGEGRGYLHIIARKGKRAVKDLRPRGCANYCDVEALQWLVTESGKQRDNRKFWLCDGIVTGSRTKHKPSDTEIVSRDIAEMCMDICRQNRILRVDNIDALIEALRKF